MQAITESSRIDKHDMSWGHQLCVVRMSCLTYVRHTSLFQDRDAHNRSWNSSKNWSLLITHYPPRDYNHTVGMDDVDAQNAARYKDTQQFYFKVSVRARVRVDGRLHASSCWMCLLIHVACVHRLNPVVTVMMMMMVPTVSPSTSPRGRMPHPHSCSQVISNFRYFVAISTHMYVRHRHHCCARRGVKRSRLCSVGSGCTRASCRPMPINIY